MVHSLGEHGVDMIVGERVDDVFAIPLKFHESRGLKRSQLMGNRALSGAHKLGDVGDAEIAAHQRVEDLDARRVGEHLEQVGEVIEDLLVGQLFEGLLLLPNVELDDLCRLAGHHSVLFIS